MTTGRGQQQTMTTTTTNELDNNGRQQTNNIVWAHVCILFMPLFFSDLLFRWCWWFLDDESLGSMNDRGMGFKHCLVPKYVFFLCFWNNIFIYFLDDVDDWQGTMTVDDNIHIIDDGTTMTETCFIDFKPWLTASCKMDSISGSSGKFKIFLNLLNFNLLHLLPVK